MSDDAPISFYDQYLPSRVPTAKTKRAKQVVARKYRLPVFRLGNTAMIFPKAGDARLAEIAEQQTQPTQRRRGRPRSADL
jgi:hypothetical protein